MIHKLGKNYHFFLATPNSVARFLSKVSPYYAYRPNKIRELPSLVNDPFLFPRFLYELKYNRMLYESTPHETLPYIVFNKNFINSRYKFPEPLYLLDSENMKREKILKFPFPTEKNFPLIVNLEAGGYIQIGAVKNTNTNLFQTKRDKFSSEKYLSLRDFVNPNLTEEEVNEEIQNLYFDKESKTFLFRLVKILYSGTPEEESKIISNLFRFEPEFAKFLSKRMFNAELIPLIHGPFLQSILKSLDERIIRFSLPKLSKPVLGVLQKSVSKNKFKEIQSSPSLEPKEGEDLISVIETELYKQFARNIYFEEGYIYTYRESGEEIDKEEIEFQNSERLNFWISNPKLKLYGLTATKLYFLTLDWIDHLRFDWILSKKEFEVYEFHRLPPQLILEIPYFPTGNIVLGGGITKDRSVFEFSLLWFDY